MFAVMSRTAIFQRSIADPQVPNNLGHMRPHAAQRGSLPRMAHLFGNLNVHLRIEPSEADVFECFTRAREVVKISFEINLQWLVGLARNTQTHVRGQQRRRAVPGAVSTANMAGLKARPCSL